MLVGQLRTFNDILRWTDAIPAFLICHSDVELSIDVAGFSAIRPFLLVSIFEPAGEDAFERVTTTTKADPLLLNAQLRS